MAIMAGLSNPSVAETKTSRHEDFPHLPNILLIVSDDHGSTDLNCFGARDLRTPNLDRLAGEGLRLTQFTVAAPICTPSRGAFLTGRTPIATGIRANDNAMPTSEFTLAEILKTRGYRTALVGKWHLGTSPGAPLQHGFDRFFGFLKGTIENYEHDRLDWSAALGSSYERRLDHFVAHDLWRDESPVNEDGTHFGELMVREVNQVLDEAAAGDDPFFIYAAFNSPHYPVQPSPRYYGAFDNLQEPRRSYAAFVATLDDQVGRILRHLEALGLADDTLVVFFGDHGHSMEARTRLWNPVTSAPAGGGLASPYRGHKGQLWEGGIRVPAIIRWPRVLPAGETRNQWITSLDLVPTIANLAGASLPRRVDGMDVFPALVSGRAALGRRLLHFAQGPNWAVREGDWKLVSQGGERLLANLDQDPGETTDLGPSMQGLSERLERIHQAWISNPDQDHDGIGADETALSDLPHAGVTGAVGNDSTPDDGCLLGPDGRFIVKGVGMEGQASATWHLGGLRDRFRCNILLGNSSPPDASVVFEVRADGAILHRSDPLTPASAVRELDLDVRGVRELVLATVAGQGNPVAIWERARVSCTEDTLRNALVDADGRWKLRIGSPGHADMAIKAEAIELLAPPPGVEYYIGYSTGMLSWRERQLALEGNRWILPSDALLSLGHQEETGPGRWRLAFELPPGCSGFVRFRIRAVGG